MRIRPVFLLVGSLFVPWTSCGGDGNTVVRNDGGTGSGGQVKDSGGDGAGSGGKATGSGGSPGSGGLAGSGGLPGSGGQTGPFSPTKVTPWVTDASSNLKAQSSITLTGTTGTVAIEIATKYQSITGFGASSAWNNLTPSDHTNLWDVDQGAGLTMLRLRIDPTALATSNDNKTQLALAKVAASKGVLVWAAPWSPVTSWQTNYGTDSSGNAKLKFNFAYATQWATLLAQFAKDAKAGGVPLFAISAQNEPDGTNFNHFEPAELVDWIKTYLGPAMEGTGVKIIAPETVNWCGFGKYEAAILADAKCSGYVPIIATHEYGCNPTAYPAIQQAGKEFWETEIYESLDPADLTIDSGLATAKIMHEALTISNVNAWHYWWIHGPADTALFLNGSSTPTKRLWVMGNYSKFVRPGFVRVKAPTTPASGVTLSAYYGNNRVVLVTINTNNSPTSLSFSVAGKGFSYSIPARSVTSLVID